MEIPKAAERKLCRGIDAVQVCLAASKRQLSDGEQVDRKVDYCSRRQELAELATELLECGNACDEAKCAGVDAGYELTVVVTARHVRPVQQRKYEAPIPGGEDDVPLFFHTDLNIDSRNESCFTTALTSWQNAAYTSRGRTPGCLPA